MSDPVTNADIEDVLAQVRRLVLQAAPREAARVGGSPGAPDRTRLVLTPALRVGEAEAPGAEATPVPSHADEPAARPGAPEAVRPEAPLPLRTRRADEAKGIEVALGAGIWEPDGSEALDWMLDGLGEDPDAAGAAPTLPRRASVAPTPVPPPSAGASAALPARLTPSPAAPAAAPSAPDEERLRALVVEVVRSELQGELGERITRNLRKLVRSEVFRALESRQEP